MARVSLLLGLLLVAGGLARAADDYDAALAFYESRIDRPPISTRLGGMQRLARTRDPRALEVLAARYARPRVPKDHERYLLAATIGAWFTEARHVDALARIRQAHRDDEDAWLWFHAARAESRVPDVARLLATIRDEKTRPFLRAALLERLAAEDRAEALATVSELATTALPRKGTARTVLLESAAAALATLRDAEARDDLRRAASAVVELLARDDLEERTRWVIARSLARAFRVAQVTTEHEFWRRVLASQEPAAGSGGTVEGRPRFFGVEATGRRVAYLLDMSDSMLEPLTPRELADARRIPRAVAGDEGEVDWSRVRNRFDLARAYLVRSLEGLGGNVEFMVIGFGDRAETFRATHRLEKASRQKVKETIRELESIEPGRAKENRPHGTLRGTTNVHGALLLAFRATGRKPIDEHEHVAEAGLEDGVDTVFLFGDGRPTRDDFSANDRFDGGAMTTDAEAGEVEQRKAGSASYGGPYRAVAHLLGDVRRMNLFRKAEIHAIAMGEADNDLMRGLAEVGLGRYRSIGWLGRDGRVNAWWIVGPWPAPDATTWEQAEAPEQAVDLDRAVRIGEQRVHWRRVFTTHKDAVVDLDREFTPNDRVTAYAYAEVEVEQGGAARLEIGSDDGVRVWLDGVLVHSRLVPRALKVGEDKVEVTLKEGVNRLLVKVCDVGSAWAFCLRIVSADGTPLPFAME